MHLEYPLLSTKELAKRLNLSHRTLENMRMSGKGPAFVRVGRLIRYTEKAVIDWIRSRSASNVQ